MKKIILLVLALTLSFAAKAQAAAHQVNVTWTASSDSTTGTPGTVSVFRAVGACPGTGIPANATTLTTTAPAAGPFSDITVTVGTWCYYTTATINASTSVPSNNAAAVVPVAPPTSLTTVVVK